LVAYKKEAHEIYQGLLASIRETIVNEIFRPVQVVSQPRPQRQLQTNLDSDGRTRQPVRATAKESLGRNDPCWCGSGKKYKHCHLRQDLQAKQAGRATTGRPPKSAQRRRRRR